ncbi:MAG: hypothetical protein ACLPIX_20955, partial [Rhodomicrobium sp.]
QAIGKQRCLAAILAFDETFHSSPRKSFAKAYMIQAFSHSLDPNRPNAERRGAAGRQKPCNAALSLAKLQELAQRARHGGVGFRAEPINRRVLAH